MTAERFSRTAWGAALYRAAHQLVDRPPVFLDPLALRIVGAEGASELRAELESRASARAAPMRAFIAVRSRFAEDCFAEAFERGVRHYVVMGAGLDTFAYRCLLSGVRVLELDHPATQAWKRERLEKAGIPVPERVRYAPVDFARETLRDGLARGQLPRLCPAFIAWLGVTPYLTREAVLGTLRVVAEDMAEGSEIVFDFATPPGDDPRARATRARLAARVRAAGEPLDALFTPAALMDDLHALGFSRTESADTATLNARYFDGREDGLRLRGGQLARAFTS